MFWLSLALAVLARAGSTAAAISASSAVSRWMVPRIVTQPDQRPVLEPAGHGVRVEVVEPRGEREVRREVLLRLQPDEVADHLVRARRACGEQVLAVQQGPVELAAGQAHADQP